MPIRPLPAAALGLLLAACSAGGVLRDDDPWLDDSRPTAVALLAPTAGHDVHGMVTFVQEGDAVRVLAGVWDLDGGQHGFHVHEHGECSAPDASSAGGHFSPNDDPHGSPRDPPRMRHDGDLGNLRAAADGHAVYERLDPQIALSGPRSIIGRSVVVHARRDDLTSQPSGDAGARLACGVIRPAVP